MLAEAIAEAVRVVKERLIAEAASQSELERLERLERERIKDERALTKHHEAEGIFDFIQQLF